MSMVVPSNFFASFQKQQTDAHHADPKGKHGGQPDLKVHSSSPFATVESTISGWLDGGDRISRSGHRTSRAQSFLPWIIHRPMLFSPA
jgi:hypothetical protein